jgi:hypothetical protein
MGMVTWGNTFMKGRKVGFVDFQCPCIGSALDDVSYFLAWALSVADERKFEKELVQSYLEALEEASGSHLEIEDIWKDYRMHMVHGFMWILTGPSMHPKASVDAMSERCVAAIEDYRSIELLEA